MQAMRSARVRPEENVSFVDVGTSLWGDLANSQQFLNFKIPGNQVSRRPHHNHFLEGADLAHFLDIGTENSTFLSLIRHRQLIQSPFFQAMPHDQAPFCRCFARIRARGGLQQGVQQAILGVLSWEALFSLLLDWQTRSSPLSEPLSGAVPVYCGLGGR